MKLKFTEWLKLEEIDIRNLKDYMKTKFDLNLGDLPLNPVDYVNRAETEPEPESQGVNTQTPWYRYGNYCGPGPALASSCNKLATGDKLPASKNSVDSQCKSHDVDYCKCGVDWKAGLPGGGTPCSKEADKDFVTGLQRLRKKINPEEKRIADIIRTYFTWKKIFG